MDKELINMCSDKRIQDKWEPKIGDLYQVTLNGSIHVIDYHKMKEVEGEDFYRGCRIFIPSIETVLEWLGDNHYALVRETDEELAYDQRDIDSGRWIAGVFDNDGSTYDGGVAGSHIEALLKAFMHLEHSVEWDGEQWK